MTSTTVTNNGTTLLTTGSTTVPTILSGSPNGIIRVFTSGRPEDVDMPDVRKVARQAAQRHHGFGSVGANPVPVPAKYNGVKGLSWDFAPVAKRVTPAPAVAPAKPAKVSAMAERGDDDSQRRLDALVYALGVSPDVAAGILRAQTATGAAPAAPAARKAAKVDRPAFLGKREGVVCETCQDFGSVRKSGSRKGGAYKTANGAATAVANGNAVPCPSHVSAAPAAGKRGKGRGKRSA